MKPRAWTSEDDATLTSRWRAGDDVPEIARDMGRSVGAIKHRACLLGLSSQSSYRWAAHEVAHLIHLESLNVSIDAMVAALGRSEKAVRTKLARLQAQREASRKYRLALRRTAVASAKPDRRRANAGVVDPARAMRRCLGGCGQMFESEWIGNRMCDGCRGRGHANAALDQRARA